MKVVFSEEFKKDYRKVKDKKVRLRILKQVKKISDRVNCGKPLSGNLSGYRNLRVKPFRIIYKIEGDCVVVCCFDHRKRVYD